MLIADCCLVHFSPTLYSQEAWVSKDDKEEGDGEHTAELGSRVPLVGAELESVERTLESLILLCDECF